MKIALSGAPGSGKARLAEALGKELENAGVILAIDYVETVEQATNIACQGYLAPYMGDVAVAIQRYGCERLAAERGVDNIITCGTLAETQMYTAISLALNGDELSWATANVVMPLYHLMAITMLDYDLILRLPLVDSEIDLDNELDGALDESLRSFKADYTTLPSWEEGQLETALGLIRGIK